ncbi:hypothetical protein Q8A73_014444 [Channa argus]|nr:hypothetical protein Q8A73_014444 [Channa argus]
MDATEAFILFPYRSELELKDKFSGSCLAILSRPLGTRCRRRAKPQSLNSSQSPVLIVSSTVMSPCPLSVPVPMSVPMSVDPSAAQPRAAKQRGPPFRSTNSPSPHDQASVSELRKQLPIVMNLLTYLWDSCMQATDPETRLAKVKQVGQVISSRPWLVANYRGEGRQCHSCPGSAAPSPAPDLDTATPVLLPMRSNTASSLEGFAKVNAASCSEGLAQINTACTSVPLPVRVNTATLFFFLYGQTASAVRRGRHVLHLCPAYRGRLPFVLSLFVLSLIVQVLSGCWGQLPLARFQFLSVRAGACQGRCQGRQPQLWLQLLPRFRHRGRQPLLWFQFLSVRFQRQGQQPLLWHLLCFWSVQFRPLGRQPPPKLRLLLRFWHRGWQSPPLVL